MVHEYEDHSQRLLEALHHRSNCEFLLVGNDNLRTKSSSLWIFSPFIRSMMGSARYVEEHLLILPDFSYGDIKTGLDVVEGRNRDISVISEKTRNLLETLGYMKLSDDTEADQLKEECQSQFESPTVENNQQPIEPTEMLEASREIKVEKKIPNLNSTECPDCGEVFSTKGNMVVHYKIKHGNFEFFLCDQCDFQCARQDGLKSHIIRRHFTKEEYREYKCEYCDFTTNHKSNLSIHKQTHKVPQSQKTEPAQTTARANSSDDKMTYQCPKCEAVYKYKHAMRAHYKSKHEGVTYPCTQCDYTTSYRSDLKSHIRARHEGLTYPCDQCSYEASKQSMLQRHIKALHDGITYPCDKCDYYTGQKETLKAHMIAKHSNTFFQCEDCNFQSKWRSSFKKHKKTHIGSDTNVKYFN